MTGIYAGLVVLCTLVVLASGCMELNRVKRDECPHWTYSGDTNGPSQWGSLCDAYATCSNGTHQSPINIITKGALEQPEKTTDLVPHYSEEHSVVFTNNGHTVMVSNNDSANTLVLPDGSVYTLSQFHFHDTSEHMLDGKSYPLEMHLVHALNGNTAVLSFLYEVGASSVLLEELIATFPSIEGANNSTVVPLLELQKLISTPFDFYNYQGSLTTPPCTENVKWFLSTTVLTATAAQITEVSTLMGINVRPTQPLNNRVVTSYHLAGSASSLQIMEALLLGCLIFAVMF